MKYTIGFFASLVFVLFPFSTHAATLTLGGSGQAVVGSTLSVPLLLSTGQGESANAVSATISYPTDLVSLVSISKAGSVITLWPQEPTVGSGSAQIEGVILNPGWSGTGGIVATLVFQVKGAGSGAIAFGDANVLANDGNATPILTAAPAKNLNTTNANTEAVPTVAAQTSSVLITSSTHPDQTKWYKNTAVSLNWTVDSSATSVRVGYDKNKQGTPSVTYGASVVHRDLTLSDGVWYFHAQQYVGGVWSPVATYKLQIDTTPPKQVHIDFPHGAVTTDPRPIALFNTTDSLSGISYYEVQVTGNDIVRLNDEDVKSNPYAVPIQSAGTSTLRVIAYDNAGNSTSAEKTFSVEALDAPTVDPIDDLAEGDILQISGLTYPNSRVDVYLQHQDGTEEKQWARTAANGAFRVIWTRPLSVGTYSVTVQTTNDAGAKSFVSQPITFKVADGTVALRVKNFVFNSLPFAVAFIALIAILFFLARRLAWTVGFFRSHRKFKHEVAHGNIHEHFRELRDAVTKEMFALQKAKTKRQLTEEEEHFLERFKKLLDKTERSVEKEITKK